VIIFHRSSSNPTAVSSDPRNAHRVLSAGQSRYSAHSPADLRSLVHISTKIDHGNIWL